MSNIRFVLVNTSHPGNIGAVARAMKNMCLEHLVLVDPQQYPHAQATARASGADDVLAKAQVFHRLDEALASADLVVGASARLRRLSWPQLSPRQCAEKIVAEPDSSRIAVLFGREHSGLTNDELERCHYLMHIPSNPEYSSLNIAAAAQILAYEVFSVRNECSRNNNNSNNKNGGDDGLSLDGEPFADVDAMERFYEHLHETLIQIGFLQTNHPRKMMRRLRRLFNRARMDRVEMNIMRGILTTLKRYSQQKSVK
ncbi:MAG: tRNA (cytosine(32)/uridine(32)-2'-O)-methyltransferase TrmJ [Gammaproteobacteria bacterium]|nr:tRNA (cytosine(32)/uridine(32)-2'-O)-methyltransferase TrmJ [Gammaproteobacteria bacterium]